MNRDTSLEGPVRNCFYVAVLAVCLPFADAAAGGLETKREFNIKAQPLDSALIEFSEQANVQVMVSTELVTGLDSPGIVGNYDTQEALTVLLNDNDLAVHSIGEDTVALTESKGDPTVGKSLPTSSLEQPTQSETSATAGQTSADTSPASAGESEVAKVIENVTVTGTRIRGARSASPVITFSQLDIERGGFATTEDLVKALPQNFDGGASQENVADWLAPNGSGNFNASGSSIDLRGLGTTSTLVLLNGRRLSPGGFSGQFTDISVMPLAAIERVEVLTDGASAIYGSDAIGGVVNFILRDDFEGAETRLRYSPDIGMDTSDFRFNQMFGKTWASGNALFSYEYYDQDSLDNADRALTASTDLRPFGGDNWSQIGGNPGTIIAGGATYAIPSGQDGTGLTPSDFVAGTVNYDNGKADQDLRGDLERHNVLFMLHHSITPDTEYFLEAQYSKREMSRRMQQLRVDLTVPDTNPFFVDPTGTGLTSVIVENYNFVPDIGPAVRYGDTENYSGATGFVVDFGSNWQAEFSGTYAQENLESTISNFPSTGPELAAALADPDPSTAFNPFADGSNTNPATIASIRDPISQVATSKQTAWSVQADINGTLFSTPSGDISVATGVQYREESLKNSLSTQTGGVDDSRSISALYAEFFIPLVGGSTARDGVRRLELSLAGRYDDYSDFGDSTNPKVGLLWAPTNSFVMRTTWGTSFKAPLLSDLDSNPSAFNFDAYAPIFAAPAIFRFGGNPDLEPETATTWTAGFQFSPESIPGFNVEMNYFDIDFEDRISSAGLTVFSFLDPRFESVVVLNPTQEQINAIVSSPRYRDLVGIDPQEIIDGIWPVDAIVPLGLVNVGEVRVNGMDLLLNYAMTTDYGDFVFGLNGSYLFNVADTLLPGDPSYDRVSTVNNPVDFRMRGSASWSRGNWGASAFLNYVDSYTNDERPDDLEPIDSWTTIDAQISYDTSTQNSLLEDVRLSLSVQNLFDEDPPFVNLSRGQAYDTNNASALGRWVSFEVKKLW